MNIISTFKKNLILIFRQKGGQILVYQRLTIKRNSSPSEDGLEADIYVYLWE